MGHAALAVPEGRVGLAALVTGGSVADHLRAAAMAVVASAGLIGLAARRTRRRDL